MSLLKKTEGIKPTQYLGSLCKRNHKYKDTNRSLRYIRGHACIRCHKKAQAEWTRNNSEKMRIKKAEWRRNNPEKIRIKMAEWRRNNPEKIRAKTAEWTRNNPKKIRIKNAEWARNNPGKATEWRRNNPEKVRAYNKKATDSLTDNYVRSALKLKGIDNISPELIEAKRFQLKIHRLIKERKN